ncbi:hypothetical protein PanWU01x14_011190 [Parasponia andersonii]|uniref:Uncharacterized protein n=1 Tax=Parasponia andersonii TaxID=3476 RepID=A0A2P5E1H5_PARAD|nr:hypothetical protein PanWU01x14_011190 [Parasponia andersonii]
MIRNWIKKIKKPLGEIEFVGICGDEIIKLLREVKGANRVLKELHSVVEIRELDHLCLDRGEEIERGKGKPRGRRRWIGRWTECDRCTRGGRVRREAHRGRRGPWSGSRTREGRWHTCSSFSMVVGGSGGGCGSHGSGGGERFEGREALEKGRIGRGRRPL